MEEDPRIKWSAIMALKNGGMEVSDQITVELFLPGMLYLKSESFVFVLIICRTAFVLEFSYL